MSAIFSGITYGIIGFLWGGPWGAVAGFAIGMGIGLLMDALAPDVPSPGQPQLAELAFPSAVEGLNIPDVLGTTKLSGNIFHYFGNRTVELTQEVEGGKGTGGGEDVVTGYEYYLSWAMGICLGPIDKLHAVYAGDEVVWSGNLSRPISGDYEIISLTGGDLTYQDVDRVWHQSLPYSSLVSQGPHGSSYRYIFSGLYTGRMETTSVLANPFGMVDDFSSRTINSSTLSLYVTNSDTNITRSIGTVNYVNRIWDPVSQLCTVIVDNPLLYTLEPNEYYDYFYIHIDGTETIAWVEPGDERNMGNAYFYFGTSNQTINTKMQGDIANTPAYRYLCYVFFDDNFIGNFNRAPAMKFIVSKFPQLGFNENEIINTYDYNPAHAIWYIQTNHWMAQLPEEYMDEVTFSEVADTLYSEGRGISILFDKQQTALAYMETILDHVGGVMRYSATGDLSEES